MQNKTYTLEERIKYYKVEIERLYKEAQGMTDNSVEFFHLLNKMSYTCDRLRDLLMQRARKSS